MADQQLGTARIGVVIDNSGVESGANKAKEAIKGIGDEANSATTKVNNATTRQVAALERQISTLGLSREELIRWRIQQQTSGDTAARLTALLDAQTAGVQRAKTATEAEERALAASQARRERLAALLQTSRGQQALEAEGARNTATAVSGVNKMMASGTTSVGQYRAALRSLPAQYTDIATQLAGGQSIGLVLLQQGGQIRDQFGSIGLALKGIGSTIGAVLNPITLTAAGLAAVAYAANQGANESTTLSQALLTSGNAAGLTSAQLQDLAAQFDKLDGVTRGQAVTALAELAATGAFTAEQLRAAGEAVTEWGAATGAATDDTVKQFQRIAEDPVKALLELNKTYGFVTTAQLEHIELLEETGNHTEAVTAAINLFGNTLKQRASESVENLGYLEKAARSTKQVFAELWDALKSVGRDDTLQDQIDAVQRKIDTTTANSQLDVTDRAKAASAAILSDLKAQLSTLQSMQKAAAAPGGSSGQTVAERRSTQANYEFQQKLNAAKDTQLDLEGKIKKMRDDALKAGVTDLDNLNKMEAVMREQDAKAKARQSQSDNGLGRASLAAIKADTSARVQIITSETQVLQAQYAAREVSANEYYARLKDYTAQATAAEAEGIQKQIDYLKAHDTNQKRSGAVAQQVAALESDLQKVRTEGAAKLQTVATQETAADQKRTQAIQAYRDAMVTGTDTLKASMASMVAKVKYGSQEYEVQTRINEVYAEQEKLLLAVAQARANGEDPSVSDANEKTIREQVAERVQAIKDGQTDLAAAQADWTNGFSQALGNYLAEAQNVAGQVSDALSSVFSGMGDALATFVTTGKLSFSDLATSIISDLTKIAAKAAISGIFGSITGGGGTTGSLATLFSASSWGFDSGGYTGPGGVKETAGVVHKGEVVWSQKNVADAGGVAAVEAMRLGKRGYSSGGAVGVSSASSGGSSLAVEITNNGSPARVSSASMVQGADGKQTLKLLLDAVADDLASGGVVAKAGANKFGWRQSL